MNFKINRKISIDDKFEKIKPIAMDLCCGKGGWTIGLLAAGWDVIGVDIEAWTGYPTEAFFMQADVRKLAGPMHDQNGRKVSLVVASPPCQEFSYRSFPFKRCRELAANVPPDKTIWQACERIAQECNAPLVLENVRGAQKYMGKAKTHYGSFYLWGDVPTLPPIGRPVKGFSRSHNGKNNLLRMKSFPGENERIDNFHSTGERGKLGGAKNRKEWSAKAAMIPVELSTWIGQCFYPK